MDSPSKPTKKGSAHVITMLYNHLHQSGLTNPKRDIDQDLHFAADNCSGQNKNQYVLQFFCMAVERLWAENIYFSFMVPGHTKFGPDRFFGMIGKNIISVDAWNVTNLVQNVSAAFKHQQNVRDLTSEDCYNFKPYLKEHYKKPDFAISEEYHFWFSIHHRGHVKVKTCSSHEWSNPHRLHKSKGDLKFDVQNFQKFSLIPLTKERIQTMRECKQYVPSDIKLDFEHLWNAWDPPLFQIKEILESRNRQGVIEYKVKFKDEVNGDKLSNNKYDEWITKENLIHAKKLLNDWNGTSKPCETVQKIHSQKEDKILVQWLGWPKQQDWTWEPNTVVEQIASNLYNVFIKNKQSTKPSFK